MNTTTAVIARQFSATERSQQRWGGVPKSAKGNVNESVVERSLNVANTEDVLRVLAGLGVGRTVVDHLLLLLLIGISLLLGGL